MKTIIDLTSSILPISRMAYKQGKKEKPPFVKSDSPERKQEEKIIPGELLCPVCKDLLTDAVVAPCCGNSSCDECKWKMRPHHSLSFLSLEFLFCEAIW